MTYLVSKCAHPTCGLGAARTEATRGALQAQAAAARTEAARLRAQYWDTLAVPACAIAGLRTGAVVRCGLQGPPPEYGQP